MAHITYESLTVNTATSLTTATIADKNRALITVETDQIRYRVDGSDPTASEGHLVEAGGQITLEGSGEMTDFRAIKVTNNATIRCTYDLRSP